MRHHCLQAWQASRDGMPQLRTRLGSRPHTKLTTRDAHHHSWNATAVPCMATTAHLPFLTLPGLPPHHSPTSQLTPYPTPPHLAATHPTRPPHTCVFHYTPYPHTRLPKLPCAASTRCTQPPLSHRYSSAVGVVPYPPHHAPGVLVNMG